MGEASSLARYSSTDMRFHLIAAGIARPRVCQYATHAYYLIPRGRLQSVLAVKHPRAAVSANRNVHPPQPLPTLATPCPRRAFPSMLSAVLPHTVCCLLSPFQERAMAKSWSMQLGSINLGTKPTGPEKPLESTPFRVLVLGDFSGRGLRASAGPQPIATKPVFVDRDNIDQVMAKMQPEVVLRLQENSPLLPLRFTELEDFHPDQLFRKLELFEGLRDLRQQLKSPKTFEAAAAKVRGWAGARPAEKKAEAPPPTAAVSGENVLEQILQQQAPAATGSVPGEGDWNQYLRKIVSPYLVEKADPKQAEFVKMVEEAIARQMRMLLHHPHFQALEAAWRGLNLLVKRLDTDHDLKLYLWDVTCHEVAADLEAEDLTKSKLYKTLVEQTVGTQGSEPWAVLVGNYTFAPSPEDALMLAKLGAVAAAARAPFLAA